MASEGLALVVPTGCRKCNVTVLEAALVASDSSNIRRRRRALRECKPRVKRSTKSPDIRSRSRYDDRRCRDKSRQYMERLLARDMDVRYMTNLKSYIDKIKSIYNCEPKGCPALKERLHNHRSQHHPEDSQTDEQNLGRECSSLQRRLGDHCSQHHTDDVLIYGDTKGNTAQTKITLSNLGTLTISIETGSTDSLRGRQAITDGSDMEALQGSYLYENNETPAEMAHRYGMNVEEQVKNWVKNIPFRPNETEADVLKRENTVNTLINSLEGLASQMQATNYTDRVKTLIENAVSKLDVFYPGPKRDQAAFKEGLRENMIQRLKEMNEKFLAGQDRVVDVTSDGTYVVDDYNGQNRRSIAPADGKRLSFAPHKYDSGANESNPTSDKGDVVYASDGTSSFIANTGTPNFPASLTDDANSNADRKSEGPDPTYGGGQRQSLSPSQRQSMVPGGARQSVIASGPRQSIAPGGQNQSNGRQNYAQGPRQSITPREQRQNIAPSGQRPSISPGQRQSIQPNASRQSKAQNGGPAQNYPSGQRHYAPGDPRQSITPGIPVQIGQSPTTNQNVGNQRHSIVPNSGRPNFSPGGARPSITPGVPVPNGQNYGGGTRQSYAPGGPRQSISPTSPNQGTGQNYSSNGRQSYAQGGQRQSMTPNFRRASIISSGARHNLSPTTMNQNITPNQNTAQNYTPGIPTPNYPPTVPGGPRQSLLPGGPRQNYPQNKIDTQGRTTNNGPYRNGYKPGIQNNINGGRQQYSPGQNLRQSISPTSKRQSNVDQIYGGAPRQSYAQGQRQSISPNTTRSISITSNKIPDQNYVNNGNRTSYLPRPKQNITPGPKQSITIGVQRPSTAPAGLNMNLPTHTASGTVYETDSTNNYGVVGTKLSVAPNKTLDISFEPLESATSQSTSASVTYSNTTDGTTTTTGTTGYGLSQPDENVNYNQNSRPSSSPGGYSQMGSTFAGRPANIETSKSYVISNNNGKLVTCQDGDRGYEPTCSNVYGENLYGTNVPRGNNNITDLYNPNNDNCKRNMNNIDATDRTNNSCQSIFKKPNYMPNADENECCLDNCNYGQKDKKNKKRYSISGICAGLENIAKATIPSGDLCSCLGDKQKPVKKKVCCGPKKLDMEKEIADWLKRTSILKETGINKKEIVDALLIQLGPFLARSSDQINKTVLKAKVAEILKSLGICPSNMTNMKSHIHKFADDLTNRLIGIINRLECSGGGSWKCGVMASRPFSKLEQVIVGPNEVMKADLKYDLIQEIEECLMNTRLAHNRFVEEDIADLLIARMELIRTGMDDVAREDIKFVLSHTDELSDEDIEIVTNCIMHAAKEIITIINSTDNRTGFGTMITARTCLSGTVSIYTSEHEISSAFNTGPIGSSTPKRNTEVEKFTPEEKAYTSDVAKKIEEWMNNMQHPFTVETDENMVKLMINDLAGEIVDHIKILQLAPNPDCDPNTFITFYVYKWLLKFEILEDIADAEPYTKKLVTQLLQLKVPDLTRSQFGKRQAMKNLQHLETEEAWTEPFVPKAQDILEDEISIWMNQQPADIYANNDKTVQNQMVHEIAEKVKEKLAADKENEDVLKDIKEWMEKVVKPSERNRVDSLSDSLVERIKKVPQDETIKAKIDAKMRAKTAIAPPVSANTVSQTTESDDYENTIKSFVLKYIEHNCDTHDSLAKGAYIQLLKSELQRFSPLERQELYHQAEAGATGDAFTSGNLNRELEYVKDVSDWLKNIPIESSYNRVGNKERIELVIGLAKNIVEVEEEVKRTPEAMDFTVYLAGIILQFLEQLPVLPDQKQNLRLMIDQLLTKIVARVNETPRPVQQTGLSVPEIIEEYIRVYGQEIADDELKLEVWTARLLKEIKKMIAETNLENVSPEDIQNKLATVALPGDESVRRFNLELDYAKEIADWVKNFPVTTPIDVIMVYDLAKKIADHESDTSIQLDAQFDQELNDYIKQWILQLPLDPGKEIDMPFVIQQLKNRIDKVKCKENKSFPSLDTSKPKSRRKSSKQGCVTCPATEDPGAVVVKAVEDWCKNLPLEGGKKDDIQQAKDDIASKLYQKIGELNDDPRYIHCEAVYEQAISDKVNKLLNSLPENLKLKGKKEDLTFKLIDSLMAARTQVENITAGINYKKRLEGIIETSLPNPLPVEYEDPGFELYKSNLASIFLLDNFDHSNDAIKLKYENKIKSEIDKFSPDALHRNAIPMAKDQLYNELYSSMYKVQLPDQCPLGDEVRVIKTRCEINDWFETLPIKEPIDAAQLLEYCTKQDILAKKIQFLEKEKKASEKILNEIVKWLSKMPLPAKEKNNIDKFASNLHEKLRHTQNDRKCFRPWDVKSKESKIMFKFGDTSKASKDKKRASGEVKLWINPNTTIGPVQNEPKQKSGDVLIDIVEKWSNNLPLPSNIPEQEQRSLKDDLATRMLMKISELNSDPQTFNENQMYNYLLNEEIEKLLGPLPPSDLLSQSKAAMKDQLVSAVVSVKPLVRQEKTRYHYVKDLEDTINIFVEPPERSTAGKAALHASVKDKIIDDFVEYQNNRDDEEGKQYYKNSMLETLARYNYKISAEKDVGKSRGEALMLGNQLICEMAKIPVPNDQALNDEVQEIRMKHQVEEFLNKISPPRSKEEKNILKNQMKDSLAKQLSYVEKKGYTPENEDRMKSLISKTLKKLSYEASKQKLDEFINRLKENEKFRKAPPIRKNADGNLSLPAYMQAGDYSTQNVGPLSQSLPIGMPCSGPCSQPAMVSNQLQPAMLPNQMQLAVPYNQTQPAVSSNQMLPSMSPNQMQLSMPSNQIPTASSSSQMQPAMMSNQMLPSMSPNQMQLAIPSTQIQPSIPSGHMQSATTSQQIPSATSSQIQPSASTQTQTSSHNKAVGLDPVSPSKALKPLIMSFPPTSDAIETWTGSQSGAVLGEQGVSVDVHRPNALEYVPNTGTYVPRRQNGQYPVSPRRPHSSLDQEPSPVARLPPPVSETGVQMSAQRPHSSLDQRPSPVARLPPPISETGVQISAQIPLIVPISEAGVQYDSSPTGSTRIGIQQPSRPSGPYVNEQAEDQEVPEECYCDMYPYLPPCVSGHMPITMLGICESCGDISEVPYPYLY